MKPSPQFLCSALVMIFCVAGQAAPKIPATSGAWPGVSWLASKGTPTSAPVDGDEVFIANNQAVTFAAGETTVRYLEIGTDGSDYAWLTPEKGSGALLVTGGTLTVSGPRFRLGALEKTKAVLNIKGGTVKHTDAGKNSRLETGVASDTTNIIDLSAGRLEITGLLLSRADRAQTAIRISGGELDLSGATANVYLPSKATGTTTAFLEQTGGKVVLGNNRVFFVGTGGKESGDAQGTVRITGGEFFGRVCVGGDGGKGTLVVGPGAAIALEKAGSTVGLILRQTGRLVFELGGTTAFNPINLTKATKQAVAFEQAGATILVDGTLLPPMKKAAPITLMTFKKGCGPTPEHLAALRVGYTGFAADYKPSLVWTATSLQLQLYDARK